jgi:glucose-6-phosphate 1-dehydrogenase
MPTVFVAFGVTGDLMRQKILPELFSLHSRNLLPEHFQIIGVSRKDWKDDDLKKHVREVLAQKNVQGDIDRYLDRFVFVQGDVSEPLVFEKLNEVVGGREALLYIALSPVLYKDAFEKLVASPLVTHAEKLRLIIEKPYGTSGAVAEELNIILYKVFKEEQLYRVDHYLGKDSLTSLPPIDVTSLQKISVSFLQKEGVEQRVAFYEATGALLDVGQNHMMEMFALTLGPTQRAAIVNDLAQLSPEQVAQQTVRSQWVGYRSLAGVMPDSPVETYFKIETTWRNIPTTFENGKYMQKEKKQIAFQYSDRTVEIAIENNRGEHEHERLILACLRGEYAAFISNDEVSAQWRFIDPIKRVWATNIPPLLEY